VVHDYHRFGGHSRYVVELACRFRRDHDVHVFTNSVDDRDKDGITFHHVPAWRHNALTTVLSFIVPGTLAIRGRFDIVHAQGLCGLRQNVITAHICQPAWFDAADRYGGQAGWRKRVFRAVVGRLEQFGLRPASAVRFIAPSTRVKDDLAAYYRLTERVRVIHHGIDTETFHPRNRARWRDSVRGELGLTPSDCAALYVGDLQKAMPAAVRTLTHVPEVKLIVVSRSDPALYAALAQAEGVAERVRFVAATTEVARYYAAADLFLFPSYYDAFGMVVTEAMASGLPVVASRAAGAGELVAHNESGWLTADAWDPRQIAEPVRMLAADPALRERMGAAARVAVEMHTWDRVAEETMAVYREVVAEKGR
jgi:UDP-glucose:(heptosyl)LPS alpha-1,3-glucosyltransferase